VIPLHVPLPFPLLAVNMPFALLLLLLLLLTRQMA